MQKMVFLFEKEMYPRVGWNMLIAEEGLPGFIPYDFGPFSREAFDDLEFLAGIGFVDVEPSSEQVEWGEAAEYWLWQEMTGLEDGFAPDAVMLFEKKAYGLSKLGRDFVEKKLWPALSERQKESIARLKLNCTKASLRTILCYICEKYPETVRSSQIREQILSNVTSISVYQY